MKKSIYKEAGKRIWEIRRRQGYTRNQLADKAEISSKFLYEIERGKKGFSVDVLYNIAEVLDVKCDYILTGEDKQSEYSSDLLGILEVFDEKQTLKLVRLLKVIQEFAG